MHPDDDISIFELLIKDEFVSIKVFVIIFDMDSIGDLLISIFEFNIFFFKFSGRFNDINELTSSPYFPWPSQTPMK